MSELNLDNSKIVEEAIIEAEAIKRIAMERAREELLESLQPEIEKTVMRALGESADITVQETNDKDEDDKDNLEEAKHEDEDSDETEDSSDEDSDGAEDNSDEVSDEDSGEMDTNLGGDEGMDNSMNDEDEDNSEDTEDEVENLTADDLKGDLDFDEDVQVVDDETPEGEDGGDGKGFEGLDLTGELKAHLEDVDDDGQKELVIDLAGDKDGEDNDEEDHDIEIDLGDEDNNVDKLEDSMYSESLDKSKRNRTLFNSKRQIRETFAERKMKNENNKLRKELQEYKQALGVHKKVSSDIKLLETKMTYIKQLFNENLSGVNQKTKQYILDKFDETRTIEEAKGLFNKITEKSKTLKPKQIQESKDSGKKQTNFQMKKIKKDVTSNMLKEGMKMEKRSGAQLLNDIPFAGTREKLNDNQINEAYDDWARLSGIKNK